MPACEHAQIQQEKRENTGKEPTEERLHPNVADRAREEADRETARKQQHRSPEVHFTQRRAHATAAQALGQKQADDDAGDLQHGEKCRDVPLECDGGCLEKHNRRGEGDQGGRAIVRGHGAAIDATQGCPPS